MASRKFTEEEMAHLRASKYILDVSPSIVHFSVEFKKLFWERTLEGKKPRAIIGELGIDPDVLGDTRISGLKGMIKRDIDAGNGFRDFNTYTEYLEGYMTQAGRIKQLEQQLAYKDQEIEFLKKIVSLGKEEGRQ